MTKRQISDVRPIEEHARHVHPRVSTKINSKPGCLIVETNGHGYQREASTRGTILLPWASCRILQSGGSTRCSGPLCGLFGSPSLIRRHSTGVESLVDVLSVPSVRNGCVLAEAHMFRERIIRAIKNRAWCTRQSPISNHVTRRSQESWHRCGPVPQRSHFGSMFRLMPVTGRLARD